MARICDLTAAELTRGYARGDLSPVEATRALLERIDAWERSLNAMFRIDRDGALAQARAAQARWRDEAPLSPLDGVPITNSCGSRPSAARRCCPSSPIGAPGAHGPSLGATS